MHLLVGAPGETVGNDVGVPGETVGGSIVVFAAAAADAQ
jgi:hypothetical protein